MALMMIGPSLLSASVMVDGQWLENPFEPNVKSAQGDVAGESKEVAWVVNSILVSAQRKQAVINGQFVREGDSISGAQVIRIEASSVHLNRDGETLVLRKKQNERFKKK